MRPRLERYERAEGALRWTRECRRRSEATGGHALLSHRINEQALCTWPISPVDIPVDNTVEKNGHNLRCVESGAVLRSQPLRLHFYSRGIRATGSLVLFHAKHPWAAPDARGPR
jgi:hypothetical protein